MNEVTERFERSSPPDVFDECDLLLYRGSASLEPEENIRNAVRERRGRAVVDGPYFKIHSFRTLDGLGDEECCVIAALVEISGTVYWFAVRVFYDQSPPDDEPDFMDQMLEEAMNGDEEPLELPRLSRS